MAPNKSKKLEVLQRREVIAKRYLTGQSMRQIADSLELNLTMVFRDIDAVRKEWHQNAQAAISEHKAKELARLDHLEMQAWTAWSMSQGDLIVTTQRGRGKAVAPPTNCPKCSKPLAGATTCSCGYSLPTAGTEVTKQTVNRKSAGDPRFLKIIQECIRQRCAIIGLNNPMPITGNDYLPVIGFEVIQPALVPEESEVEVIPSSGEGDGSSN